MATSRKLSNIYLTKIRDDYDEKIDKFKINKENIDSTEIKEWIGSVI